MFDGTVMGAGDGEEDGDFGAGVTGIGTGAGDGETDDGSDGGEGRVLVGVIGITRGVIASVSTM